LTFGDKKLYLILEYVIIKIKGREEVICSGQREAILEREISTIMLGISTKVIENTSIGV